MDLKNAVAALSVMGVVLYGGLHACAARFYSEFNVEPEEVGLGYSKLIAQSAVAWLVTLLILAVAFGLARLLKEPYPQIRRSVLVGTHRVLVAVGRPQHWRRLAQQAHPTRKAEWPNVALLFFVPGMLVAIIALFWTRSPELAKRAKGGEAIQANITGAVDSLTFYRHVYENPVGLRADRVRAAAVRSTNDPYRLSERERLLYLGAANGTSVLYDISSRATLRVPTNALVICTRLRSTTRGGCTPAK